MGARKPETLAIGEITRNRVPPYGVPRLPHGALVWNPGPAMRVCSRAPATRNGSGSDERRPALGQPPALAPERAVRLPTDGTPVRRWDGNARQISPICNGLGSLTRLPGDTSGKPCPLASLSATPAKRAVPFGHPPRGPRLTPTYSCAPRSQPRPLGARRSATARPRWCTAVSRIRSHGDQGGPTPGTRPGTGPPDPREGTTAPSQ